MKWVYIFGCVMWICFAATVSVAIYYTRNINCLWFMVFPMFIRIKTSSGGSTNADK